VKVLIDTACWLWSLTDPEHLNKEARDLLSDPVQVLYLSAASSWEIAIKSSLGRLRLPESPEKYIPSRMAALNILGLPIEHTHALRVFRLPTHHRDPFDRILVAQAQIEKLTILTADRVFAAYDVSTIWAKP
jgi:PIN domain nuclease of toxin-antitoxin system